MEPIIYAPAFAGLKYSRNLSLQKESIIFLNSVMPENDEGMHYFQKLRNGHSCGSRNPLWQHEPIFVF